MADRYKVCIVGCGSIGLHIAARLCLGKKASVFGIARGQTLASLRETVSLRTIDNSISESFSFDFISEDATEVAKKQPDAIVVAVKSTQLESVHKTLATLLDGADANLPVFFALNGIPWYYFHRHGGARDGEQLPLLDPKGQLWKIVGPERAVHVVCRTACSVPSPGNLQINSIQNKFCICEPSGESSPRAMMFAEALKAGGVESSISDSMRKEIWIKLLGNICFNPVSVLTGGTVANMATRSQLRENILKPLIAEAVCVAQALGIDTSDFPSPDVRLDSVKTNQHPPSMLQDFRGGKPLEIDSILAQVHAFGESLQIATPTLSLVMTLVQAAHDFQLKEKDNANNLGETPCKKQRS